MESLDPKGGGNASTTAILVVDLANAFEEESVKSPLWVLSA